MYVPSQLSNIHDCLYAKFQRKLVECFPRWSMRAGHLLFPYGRCFVVRYDGNIPSQYTRHILHRATSPLSV